MIDTQNILLCYVGIYGTYLIPENVIKKAAVMNRGKSLNDKRTKGAKYIDFWGKYQDAQQDTINGIKKHLRNE